VEDNEGKTLYDLVTENVIPVDSEILIIDANRSKNLYI